MVGKHYLGAVGNVNLGLRNTCLFQRLQLCQEFSDIHGNAISQNAGYIGVKHSAGQKMQRKTSIRIDDGMSRIGSSLKTNYDVRRFRQIVCNLPLSFISPVCTDNCLNHTCSPFLHLNCIMQCDCTLKQLISKI